MKLIILVSKAFFASLIHTIVRPLDHFEDLPHSIPDFISRKWQSSIREPNENNVVRRYWKRISRKKKRTIAYPPCTKHPSAAASRYRRNINDSVSPPSACVQIVSNSPGDFYAGQDITCRPDFTVLPHDMRVFTNLRPAVSLKRSALNLASNDTAEFIKTAGINLQTAQMPCETIKSFNDHRYNR